ncbi:2-methoxy-6-polyprenyl-1,4-benzoquinol methylase, mitochondrial [Hondaea fermentalgiana]|uniref:2-methoxy-6-polyprenyl-1,4-benzoquinol methylase, mitochondrial n=1 Tax=Hondaea fermentalgiana TaxID=2315210 RepID=A0A2R5GRI9_9STRA|nr:2-methoxy-6-polyprenyl-1,4-benzoquinol methylase, mitochondrial [Hondaea fermentalgiana]|eukprot:GBG33460.1 2-methoxy-6-polyprenyl-1,4-benzoquinol methylase, mitochondrial [Hondaea fermentalgiana]
MLYGVGTFAGMSVYQTWQQDKKRQAEGEEEGGEEMGGTRFDSLAKEYDDRISTSERMAGILRLRKGLLGDVKGETLEVAAGTGRNLEYYPHGARVTLTDTSPKMLERAKEKAQDIEGLSLRVGVGGAEDIPFPDDTFDHVVDTFGLCSMPDPRAALLEMRRVCKPDGDIRLLEHGRSFWGYSLLNKYLDARAPAHVKDWGCEWNRDIGNLVKETPGLEIVSEKYHHFGTTYEYVLKKTEDASPPP